MDTEIQKKALYEQIADKIEEMILESGDASKRTLPSENVLAAGFGVSRPVVREALRTVRERGLIKTRQGAETVICSLDDDHISGFFKRLVTTKNIAPLDIFSIRITLEKLSIRLAAENADADGVNKLRSINRELANAQDSDKKTELDIAFHREIARLSENGLLLVLIDSFIQMLGATSALPDSYDSSITFHDKIISSIENGDADGGEKLIEEHLIISMRNFEIWENREKR